MKASWRKPFGIFSILLLITIWAVLIASLSAIVGEWHVAFQSVFYLIAGIIWILPLKPLLLWMETGRFKALPDESPAPQDNQEKWRE
jgi:Protein of unknown function (DUF2842)